MRRYLIPTLTALLTTSLTPTLHESPRIQNPTTLVAYAYETVKPEYQENIQIGNQSIRVLSEFPEDTRIAILASEQPRALGFFLSRAQNLVNNKASEFKKRGQLYAVFTGTFYDPKTNQLISALIDHNGVKIGSNNYAGGAKFIHNGKTPNIINPQQQTNFRSVSGLVWLREDNKPKLEEAKKRRIYPNKKTWRAAIGIKNNHLVHIIQERATIDNLVETVSNLNLENAVATDAGSKTAYYSPQLGIIRASNEANLKNVIVLYALK